MATKVRTLKEICGRCKTVNFVVHTPGSERGIKTQSVQLRKPEVHRTSSGNWVICGRDIQLEAERSGKPTHQDPIIRSFRIDRIVNRTINWY